MSLYENVPQLIKMLRNLDGWLEEGAAFAVAREFDPDALLQARLFPDMHPLVRQVQNACDTAKFYGARLSETEAPKHPDTETTMLEIRARVAATIKYLEGLDAAPFEGSGSRALHLPMLKGGSVTGDDYTRDFALPNFYFHATTAYALLRQSGAKLGKKKFLGRINIAPAE